MNSNLYYNCDVLVIGSGAAGLSLALRIANYYKVILISKSDINECATLYAQGGIAAVLNKTDTIESHINDTLISGAGLCNYKTVYFVAKNASHCIQWLIDQGVEFDKKTNHNGVLDYHLTREGGHSQRRIFHTADHTGEEIQNKLILKAMNNINIKILENTSVIDLIVSDKNSSKSNKVVGAFLYNNTNFNIKICQAHAVVIATGGAGMLYKYTTNPSISSGDGIALAWRAGCKVSNLEFTQFHPTCLFHPKGNNFLLTEALRGEGAKLIRPDMSSFMLDFDNRAELAPRDIVTRAIFHEMKRLNENCMYLDISHKSKKFIYTHFPTIYKKLLNFNLDLTTDKIPIVPAAHYTCGGVMVNLHGRTNILGLYAIGEVSCTGLHGANRLASNSLLECLVYSWSASKDLIKILPYLKSVNLITSCNQKKFKIVEDYPIILNKKKELRADMWHYMGIIRTEKSLQFFLNKIFSLQKDVNKYYHQYFLSKDIIELRNTIQVAELMVKCALMRKESRGLHYITDYPNLLSKANPTYLIPDKNSLK